MAKFHVPKVMTSFKLSHRSRDQIARIRDARNKMSTNDVLAPRLTNSDTIRQLLDEECLRIDKEDLEKASFSTTPKTETPKKKAAKKPAKKPATKKGK